MSRLRTKKCAHIACLCDVTNSQEFCGESCRAAGRENVEISCQCDHLECPCVIVVATMIRESSHREN
jgi:hypothetical protein